LAGTLTSPDPGEVVYTWPATPDLNGRALIREDYVLYDDTDTQIGSGQRSGDEATTTISATAGTGRYVRSNAVTDAGAGPLSPASNAVTVTAAAPVNTVVPVITGTAEVGETLTASTGTWTGAEPITYAYQWLRDGVDIDGATDADYVAEFDDLVTQLSVRVTATNGAGSQSETSLETGLVQAPAAQITAVPANGWEATYPSPPVSFDPINDPEVFTLTRTGALPEGGTDTLSEVVRINARVRLPHPDQSTLTADVVALSRTIYEGETIPGVTVTGRDHRPPTARWDVPDRQHIKSGGVVNVALSVHHWEARNGRPVRAVKFVCGAVEVTVSSMTTRLCPETGFYISHFATTMDLSSLDDGVRYITAVIYPWIGPAWDIADTANFGVAYPAVAGIGPLSVMLDQAEAFAGNTAYVDTGGDDGTGTVNDPALPFASLRAAALALQTAGGGDMFGEIVLTAGQEFTHQQLGNITTTDAPTVIRSSVPGTRAVLLTQSTDVGYMPQGGEFRDIEFRKTTTENITFFHNRTFASKPLKFVGCFFNAEPAITAGQGNFSFYWRNAGIVQFFDCVSNVPRTFAGNNIMAAYVIGCVGIGGDGIYGIGGSRTNFLSSRLAQPNRPEHRGMLINQCFVSQSGANAIKSDTVSEWGLHIVGTVIETNANIGENGLVLATAGQPAFNVIVSGCTSMSPDTSVGYSRVGEAATFYDMKVASCVLHNIVHKGDVFDEISSKINWQQRYGVDFKPNTELSAKGGDVHGASTWRGEVALPGWFYGTSASVIDPDFVKNASSAESGGDNSGVGGDYTPQDTSQIALIPKGQAEYPFDILGRPVPDDGTGLSGAYQVPA